MTTIHPWWHMLFSYSYGEKVTVVAPNVIHCSKLMRCIWCNKKWESSYKVINV